MPRVGANVTPRKTHPHSRPLPGPIGGELPPHIKAITYCALAGTVNAPMGSTLPEVFFHAAEALIREGQRIYRNEHAADFMKAAGR